MWEIREEAKFVSVRKQVNVSPTFLPVTFQSVLSLALHGYPIGRLLANR